MNEERETLADRWLRKAKNNPLIASIIVIATIIGFIAQVYEPILNVLPTWLKDKIIKLDTKQCKINSNFAVDVLYSDARVLQKNRITESLELFGYVGRRANTSFQEYNKPGKLGTAWLTYPSCIGEKDPRLDKVVRIMKENGYSEEKNTLVLIPHSSGKFSAIQISLF
jgi:hypothetical protein